MKILAFTDFHASVTALKHINTIIKKHKPDLAICCGDITVFEQHIDAVMKRLGNINTPLLLIHGNHEEPEIVNKLSKKYSNITFLHKRTTTINNTIFIGYGGEGFIRRDKTFEQFMKIIDKKIRTAQQAVLITHQPPYGTNLDSIHNDYVGNQSFTTCIKQHPNIILALSGHIHETFGKKDKLNNTTLLNPGPFGTLITLP